MQKRKHRFKYIYSTVFASALAGALVGLAIVLFKYCAGHAVHLSEEIYHALSEKPILIIPAVAATAVVALLFTLLYRIVPGARGGGIPTSVGILRGALSLKWLSNAISVFFASMVTFITGVPLGTEGPSVQIGTALGKGVALGCGKKNRALGRYIMTGGASAGFTVATGSPIAGLMFALEEVHQKISPLILLATTAAVVAAKTVSDILSPVFGISAKLFHVHTLFALSAKDFWIPVAVSVTAGLGSVVFLKYYKVATKFIKKKLGKTPEYVKLLSVILLTLVFGLISGNFISTGHHLSDVLLEAPLSLYVLIAALIIRSTLMILASNSGITGGMFLPILALGALVASLTGSVLMMLGLSAEYYPIIVTLGITASIAGMMKMPVTAIVFAIEALALSSNILPVIITVALTYLITEVFGVKSITEKVLETRLHHLHGENKPSVYESFVTVREDSFAVDKQVRDVLWPCDMIVLSVKRPTKENAFTDDLGETMLLAGDVLHLRYPAFNLDDMHGEISALVGAQEFTDEKISKV